MKRHRRDDCATGFAFWQLGLLLSLGNALFFYNKGWEIRASALGRLLQNSRNALVF